jgi:hypothetical protein
VSSFSSRLLRAVLVAICFMVLTAASSFAASAHPSKYQITTAASAMPVASVAARADADHVTLDKPGSLNNPSSGGDWPTYAYSLGRTGFNGPEPTFMPQSAPNITPAWQYPAKGSPTTMGGVSSQPVVSSLTGQTQVFWGAWDGYEYSAEVGELAPGKLLWRSQYSLGTTTVPTCPGLSSTGGVGSTAAVADVLINQVETPVLFVGGGNGFFYGLDATNGDQIWAAQLYPSNGQPADNYFIWSSPAVNGNYVYVGLSSLNDCPLVEGQFFQLDLTKNMQIKYTFNVVPGPCVGGGVWSSPAIDTTTNTIYITTGNLSTQNNCTVDQQPYAQALVALDANDVSSVIGYYQVAADHDSDFGTSPTLFIEAGVAMVGAANKNGTFYAFDRAGFMGHVTKPAWQVTIATGVAQGGTGSIATAAFDSSANVLYIAGGTPPTGSPCPTNPATVGTLQEYSLSTTPPQLLWQNLPTPGVICFNHPRDGTVEAAVTAVSQLVVVESGANLYGISESTGAIEFSFQDPNTAVHAAIGPASISYNALYVGDWVPPSQQGSTETSGTLYAFQ